mgnify:CR=1 FL=1
MADMANLTLAQVYPRPGWEYQLNCCGNPDCGNYGIDPDFSLASPRGRNAPQERERLARISNAFAIGLGSYEMKGGDAKDARTSTVYEYQAQPFDWTDGRKLTCQHVLDDDVCGFGFSLLTDQNLEEEIRRLVNQNGVLDGAACRACGRRYLAAPWEFVLNGRNEPKAGNKRKSDGARSVRVMHRRCEGKPGARFTVSLPHVRQRKTSDNQKILRALSNSAGIHDIQRVLAGMEDGERCGMSRIYNRIFWLEGQLLAYETEQLARWKEEREAEGKPIVHRLCHDDIVLGVNWQTDTDRKITPLNCSITADADSGYVYRIDIDFDPRVEPVALFRDAYLDDQGIPKDLRWEYTAGDGTTFTHPRFHFQRPTGRLDEHAFFAACLNHLGVFRETKGRRVVGIDKAARKVARDMLDAQLEAEMDLIKTIYYGWFDLKKVEREHRASFSGVTVQQVYTKAAHFAALKGTLPKGEICLITEQEGTLVRTIPHIFRSEIDADSFTWLIVGFDKEAKKPQIEDRTRTYRKALRAHRDAMIAAGRTEPTEEEVGLDYVRAKMSTIYRETPHGQRPWPGSSFQSSAYPHVWIKSPVQAAGETEKTVGFPILKRSARQALKQYDFKEEVQGPWLRSLIADEVWRATLQAVSTFMNSLRERLSPAARSGVGGARSGGSYVQGAMFNPRVLIAILNIFRIQYNFFEARTYVAPWNGEKELRPTVSSMAEVRVPGRDQHVTVYKRRSHKPRRLTPAMRHGIWPAAEGDAETPNLMKVLYYPWLYARTPLWKKFTTSGIDLRRKAATADARRRNRRPSAVEPKPPGRNARSPIPPGAG